MATAATYVSPKFKRWRPNSANNGHRKISPETFLKSFVFSTELEERRFVFRGQANRSWNLTPSLFRTATSVLPMQDRITALRHFENDTLPRFKAYYKEFFKEHSNGDSFTDDEWRALAQHYRVPTPLLDWSYSPFVSLFMMALSNDPRNKVGRIFCLDSRHLENRIKVVPGRINRSNRRSYVQQGLFTFVNDSPAAGTVSFGCDTIDEVSASMASNDYLYFCDIDLSGEATSKIVHICSMMNITRQTIFPDSFEEGIVDLLKRPFA